VLIAQEKPAQAHPRLSQPWKPAFAADSCEVILQIQGNLHFSLLHPSYPSLGKRKLVHHLAFTTTIGQRLELPSGYKGYVTAAGDPNTVQGSGTGSTDSIQQLYFRACVR
jgi:hypothetical protein